MQYCRLLYETWDAAPIHFIPKCKRIYWVKIADKSAYIYMYLANTKDVFMPSNLTKGKYLPKKEWE